MYVETHSAISEVETALSSYNSFGTTLPSRPIWAIAENYRFEPAFMEVFLKLFFWLLGINFLYGACYTTFFVTEQENDG